MYFSEWLPKHTQLLHSRIGPYKVGQSEFLFEPNLSFYELISQGNIEDIKTAMQRLAKHIGLTTQPLIVDWKSDGGDVVLLDHSLIQDTSPAGQIDFTWNRSVIKLGEAIRYSPYILGATLAHELTHYYLFKKQIILDEEWENELLTDYTVIFLGLGKLLLNGSPTSKWTVERNNELIEYTYKVGYLSQREAVYCTHYVLNMRRMPLDTMFSNLRTECIETIKSMNYAQAKLSVENAAYRLGENVFKPITFCWIIRPFRQLYEWICGMFAKQESKMIVISCEGEFCSQKLRVPASKKIEVTCPRCGYVFSVNP